MSLAPQEAIPEGEETSISTRGSPSASINHLYTTLSQLSKWLQLSTSSTVLFKQRLGLNYHSMGASKLALLVVRSTMTKVLCHLAATKNLLTAPLQAETSLGGHKKRITSRATRRALVLPLRLMRTRSLAWASFRLNE